MTYTDLGQYILALCESQNLSMRQASIRAGLEPSTISKILRRDGQVTPTPDTLWKLAEGLRGDFLHMMGLAGHLPPSGDDGDDPLSAELYAKLQRHLNLVRQAAAQDPDRAAYLLEILNAPFEALIAVQGAVEGEEVSAAEEATENGRVAH